MNPIKLFTDTTIGVSLGSATMKITGDTMGQISPAMSNLTQSMVGFSVMSIPMKGFTGWFK